MTKENKKEIIEDMDDLEIIQNIEEDDSFSEMVPSININTLKNSNNEKELISDNALMGIYGEILNNLKEDRLQIEGFVGEFAEMVINSGDASSASKEALVSLVRAKIEASDKMSRIADLMTRVKLKDKDTFPRYLAANQKNTININGEKKNLIQSLNKQIKQEKKQRELENE